VPVYEVDGLGRRLRITAPAPGEFDPVAWAEFTRSTDLFGLDVESTALTPRGVFDPGWRLRLIQFGTAGEAWVLDVADPAQEAAAAGLLAAARFVTHTPYDVRSVWAHFRVALGQRVLDTHLISKIINPDERAGHDLKGLATRHLDGGLQRGEDELHAWFAEHAPAGHRRGHRQRERWGWDHIPAGEPVYAVYAGLDAIYCRHLLRVLLRQVRGVEHIAHIEHWLSAQCTGVSLRGIRLDLPYVRALLASVERQAAAAEDRITAGLGFPSRSPKFAAWVDDHGPVPGTGRTPTGRLKITASIDGITQVAPAVLKAAEAWPAAERDLLAARDVIARTANVLSNLRQFLACADPDGYVHPDINTLRARTARMSVTNPALQTLRKPGEDPGSGRLRHCFMADPGYVLVTCDFAQVEVRVTAALSRDERLMRAILAGEDVHDVTARALYGPGFTKTQRTIGKRATFGTIYGGGARALAAQTGVRESEAAGIIARWRRAYPKVGQYATRVSQADPVVTATGRRIPADPARRYANINYAVQSASRDLLVQAVYDLLTRHDLAHALWLMVHDEVILHVPAADAERVRALLEQAMTFDFRGVPITAEAEVLGTHWGKVPEDEAEAA
jgi:DNA polymerase I